MTEKRTDPSGDNAQKAIERMDRQINELKGIANSAQARKDKGLKYTKETVVAERGRQDAISQIESCRNDLSGEMHAIADKTKEAEKHLAEANDAKRKGEEQLWAQRVEETLFGTDEHAGTFAGVSTLRSDLKKAYDDVVTASGKGDKQAAQDALDRVHTAADGLRAIRTSTIEGLTPEQLYDKLHSLRYDTGAHPKTRDIEHRLYKLLHNDDKTDGFYDGFIDLMDRQIEGNDGLIHKAEQYAENPSTIPKPRTCYPGYLTTICT